MAEYSSTKLMEVGSTNSYVLSNLDSLPDKHIVIASKQTDGRGRLQRKWLSDIEGNVYMTILLKPFSQIKPENNLANLTQYMSVVLCRVLEKYNINPQIKWPNDVLVDGHKIAGILSETSIKGQTLNGFALGLGVNLNMPACLLEKIDQPATSLNLLIGETIDVDTFIDKITQEFFSGYKTFMQNGFVQIKDDYKQRSNFLGKDIVISHYNKTIPCFAKNINDDGTLLIKDKNNVESKVMIGDLVCF